MNLEEQLKSDPKIFGFWLYLMTDLVIFASLFASFIVLRPNISHGPSGKELFDLSLALAETLLLLASSFTCALGMLSIYWQKKFSALFWFALTFLLGLSFLAIEIFEFTDFIERGFGPSRSAFLSSFFTLVGAHGLHISSGLLWMLIEIFRIHYKPLSQHNVSRIFRMVIFWHFLDFVWIFIFTTVYGMGLLL